MYRQILSIPHALFRLILEVCAGVFLLLAVFAGGGVWWLEQPENRAWIQQKLSAEINARLDQDQAFHFEDMSLRLMAQPFGVKVLLHNAIFQQTGQDWSIPHAELDYPIQSVLMGRTLPYSVAIEGLRFKTEAEADTASLEQVSAALLWWFAPEMLPGQRDWRKHTIFTDIAEVHLRDFRALTNTQQEIQGGLALSRARKTTAIFTGTIGALWDGRFEISRVDFDSELVADFAAQATLPDTDFPARVSGSLQGQARLRLEDLKTLEQKTPSLMVNARLENADMVLEADAVLGLQKVEVQNSRIMLSQGGTIQATGFYQYAADTGVFDVMVQDVPHHLLRTLSLDIPVQSGVIHTGQGQVTFAQDRFAVKDVQAELRDLVLTLAEEPLKIPALQIEMPSLALVRLKATEPFDYGDFQIRGATLEGDPEGLMHGEVTMDVASKAALGLIDNPYAGLIALQDDIPLQARFRLEQQKFYLDEVESRAVVKGQILAQPLRLDHFRYSDDIITLAGVFSGAAFTVRSAGGQYQLDMPEISAETLKNWLVLNGFDAPEMMGILAAQVLVRPDAAAAELDIAVSLDDFGLHDEGMGIQKKPTEAGTLELHLQQQSNQQWRVHLAMDVPKLSGTVQAVYDHSLGKIIQIAESRIVLDQETLILSADRSSQGLEVALTSQNLTPQIIEWIKGKYRSSVTEVPEILAPIKKLHWSFADGVLNAGSVSATFQTEDMSLEALRFDFAEPEPVQGAETAQHRLDFVAGKHLNLYSPNAHHFLRALDVTDSISGGIIQIDLLAQDSAFAGEITMQDFAVLEASGAVKFLQALSLTGFLPLLIADGLPFHSLRASATGTEALWHLHDLKAYGPGLSMTFDGTLDMAAETITGAGAASPTSILNNILGYIPIFGDILTGSDGGGLVAVNYSVSGSIENPETTVQPLSLLTPGILRNIFGGIGDSLQDGQ